MERPPLVVLLLGFSSIYKKPSSCRSSAVGNPSRPPVAARPPVDNGKPLPTGLLTATRHSKNDRGYLASAVFNVPPAALPGATRRREARGAPRASSDFRGINGAPLRATPFIPRFA